MGSAALLPSPKHPWLPCAIGFPSLPGIDLHTHLAPRVDEPPIGPPALYRPDLLEEYLDEADLDEAIVTVPPPFFRQDLDEPDARTWVRSVNDGLLQARHGHDRLTPLAYLPLEHPELALAEYERVRDDATWAGLAGAAGGGSYSLAAPELAPLWGALEDDGRMLLLHPGATPDPRLNPFYLANLLGNPGETALAAAQLVFGDVLALHPGLRFVLVHCGGLLPAVVGRWQRGTGSSSAATGPSRWAPGIHGPSSRTAAKTSYTGPRHTQPMRRWVAAPHSLACLPAEILEDQPVAVLVSGPSVRRASRLSCVGSTEAGGTALAIRRSLVEPAGRKHSSGTRPTPRRTHTETCRRNPPRSWKIRKPAGQSPFAADSRMATHSTCDVIGNRSNTRRVRTRYPPSRKYPKSRASAAGSQAT
ncbi:hypothetical protein SALBM311S_04556 [Streptomyces alboniger]